MGFRGRFLVIVVSLVVGCFVYALGLPQGRGDNSVVVKKEVSDTTVEPTLVMIESPTATPGPKQTSTLAPTLTQTPSSRQVQTSTPASPSPSVTVSTTFAPTTTTTTATPGVTSVPSNVNPAPTQPSGAAPVVSRTNSSQPFLPQRLKIPSIYVNAPVEPVGLKANGAMALPKKFSNVGWFETGPIPGEKGNAVIAGHLDSYNGVEVFWNLKSLVAGDRVFVERADKSVIEFVVVVKESYPFYAAPISKIFGSAPEANLNLVTCGGIFDKATQNYSERLVVYTTLVKNPALSGGQPPIR